MSDAENNHRIDYVEFGTTDMARTKQFYAQAFGWAFTDYGPDYTSFHDGRIAGGFWTDIAPGGSPLVVLYAANLEDAYARVKASGGSIRREVFSFPGGRRFHFADPSGNELAVWSEEAEEART